MSGIFGAYDTSGKATVLEEVYLGLYALQHRGQESAGIVTSHQGMLFSHKGMGLVANVFANGDGMRLPGDIAIGQELLQDLQAACRIDVVEDHAADPHPRLEGREAVHDGGDAAGDRGAGL